MSRKAPEPTATFSKVLARYKTSNPRLTAMLKAWREHPDHGKLWLALQIAARADHRPLLTAADFIGVVLGSTMPAKVLNDHAEQVLQQFEKLKIKIGKVVADADYPFDLWRDLQRFEKPLRELGQSAYDMRTPAGGRKDQNDSRDRKLFATRMFRYLHNTCGQHLPKEVATMVDILFPGPEDTERQVRSWLPAKTTRRPV
jgi:hypothetical protein